ncbi:iron(III) transport system substrate-binding protein [Actinokineospora alba]|uniref:Iron(III) transport system substrate-binding protein n=1 Tax=Actinokineospora alba TaxID=504798 RepID=A0A1H0N6G5_9PSEU|nr:extracellular solute-binding protein [Actinokineospora alba]TDP68579.1 iron(III) transport system substrate-binding protein [Actinokineospora alba]SDH82159.1 iron(III) transport system substrate-binding protein [Actinokineospora alba]SDO87950.1 iron(III) transport system substrate-binding protein [Actinokineospora alba]
MGLRSTRLAATILATLLGATLAGCGAEPGSDGPVLTVYSGRNENLVKPLLDKAEKAIGAKLEVRYGDTAALAGQLAEEGERSPADVFFSQDAGALGALASAGRLNKLPQPVLDASPEQWRGADGTWVSTSLRTRVVIYDPKQVAEADLPKGIDDLLDPKWKGKIGFAPSNASWQAFVTSIRVLRGEDGAKKWLEGFKANDPQKYDNNIKIRDAADDGKLALGLTNHYYWYEKAHQIGVDKMSAKLHFIKGNDPGALINSAGVGVLKSSKNQELANKFAEFLMSPESQKYFADKTAEYPVRAGITSTEHKLVPLSELQPPDLKLADLQSLPKTAELLRQVGLL